MKKNRYGSYEDYERELDEEAERKAHDAEECEGYPFCLICISEREEREEADMQGYYDSRGHWRK